MRTCAQRPNQNTCDVHTVSAEPDAGVHNWGAKLGVRAGTCNHHFGLLHHSVNGCLVCSISHKNGHVLHCKPCTLATAWWDPNEVHLSNGEGQLGPAKESERMPCGTSRDCQLAVEKYGAGNHLHAWVGLGQV